MQYRPGGVGDDALHFPHHGFELLSVDALMERVRVIVAGGEVHSGHAEFRRDDGDVAERSPGSPETLSGEPAHGLWGFYHTGTVRG